MTKRIILYLIAALIIAGCNKSTVKISGSLIGPREGSYIYLSELLSQETRNVDSVKLTGKGTFSFTRELSAPSFYLLRIGERNFLTMLLEPGENVEIRSYYDSLNYPMELSGSKGTELMNSYNTRLRNTITRLTGLSNIYRQNVNNPDLPRVIESLDSTAATILDDINAYTKNYIDSNLGSLVSLIALYQQVAPNVYVLNPSKDYQYYMKVDSSLSHLYPDYEPVKSLHEQVRQLLESPAAPAEVAAGNTAEGLIAPEIILPGPQGDTISLSSTRGSVVLLDFWASWCAPCRHENPNLVKAYNQYHRKGFQIYQVSLDKTKEAWQKGIEEDQLDRWIHVSDLQYWSSKAAQLYKIESIPSNFLLDREGRIIARNLRGEALQAKLAELFK